LIDYIKKMNNRNHPYQRFDNNNYYNKRNDNNNNKRNYYLSNDGQSAHYLIHPYSMYNTDQELFFQPNEIGSLLSESK
jgi:hypothetical protein